jgi:hypothetical protein
MDQAYVRPKAKGQKVKLERFPQPFVLRPLTQEEVRGLYAVCRRKNGTIHRERYLTELMCRSIEKPNLQDQALQEAYGVLGADRLLCRMLLAGEFAYLAQQVRKVCGFEMEEPT